MAPPVIAGAAAAGAIGGGSAAGIGAGGAGAAALGGGGAAAGGIFGGGAAAGGAGLAGASNGGFFGGLGKLFSGPGTQAFTKGAGTGLAQGLIASLFAGQTQSQDPSASLYPSLFQMGFIPDTLDLDTTALKEARRSQGRVLGLQALADQLNIGSAIAGPALASSVAATQVSPPFPQV